MNQAVGVPSNHGVLVQASLATAHTHQMFEQLPVGRVLTTL